MYCLSQGLKVFANCIRISSMQIHSHVSLFTKYIFLIELNMFYEYFRKVFPPLPIWHTYNDDYPIHDDVTADI